MAQIPHWDQDPTEWNTLVIGKFRMPGVWEIDFPCRRDLDVKKAKGKDGARFKDQGYEPSKIDMVGRLTTADDLQELNRILPNIHPKKKGAKRDTFAVSHPSFTLLGISSVYITELRSPKLERGILSITIRALEFVAQPKAVAANKAPPVSLEEELKPGTPPAPNSTDKL